MLRRVTCAAVLAISACRGGAGSGAGSGSGSASAAAKPTDEAAKRCAETALFAPRNLGKGGNDLFRDIEIDPVTKDVYAADLHTIVRVPPAGGEPAVVLTREGGVGGRFWLRPDRILLPGDGVSNGREPAVLFSTPREGGELTRIIPFPPSDAAAYHQLRDVRVIGDDVYWHVEDGTPGKRDPTHSFFTTSWKEPGTPKLLFTSKNHVGGDLFAAGFVVAAGKAYIAEELGKTQVEHVIDLATGAASRLDPGLGGFVAGGDSEWIVVRKPGTRAGEMGTFRMKPDGSQALQFAKSWASRVATQKGTWAMAAHDPQKNVHEVSTAVAATGEQKVLGCVDGDATVHAIALADEAVYVSVFRQGKATIVRYAR